MKLVDDKDEHLKLRVLSNKLRSHEFNDSEKIHEIHKSNQKLMNKLYEISQGKQSTLRNLMGNEYANIQQALHHQQQHLL